MGFNYYEKYHLHDNVYHKNEVDNKMNAIKTEITNLITTLINAEKKPFYRGKMAHNNDSNVSFYVNQTTNHALNVSQSKNDDFVCNSVDNTKLQVGNEGTYLLSIIDGYKSSTNSHLKIHLDVDEIILNDDIDTLLQSSNNTWKTLNYTFMLYIKKDTKIINLSYWEHNLGRVRILVYQSHENKLPWLP